MRDFNHTVNILVQAYLNGTLEHGNCKACAVGNIIRGNGYDIVKDAKRKNETQWLLKIMTDIRGHINRPTAPRVAARQIASTGYSIYELHLIEYSFENCGFGKNEDEYMFNGLMSVVDTLADIHNIDLTAKEEAKKLFVKVETL